MPKRLVSGKSKRVSPAASDKAKEPRSWRSLKLWVFSGLCSVPLLICGFVWNPEHMGIAALCVIAYIIILEIAELGGPLPNSGIHYYSGGREVLQDGTPAWSHTEDTQSYGKLLGTIWFVVKRLGMCITLGWLIMTVYGGYAAVRLLQGG